MAIIADVSRMEHESHETPSEPQVSVGADMTGLYDAPLFCTVSKVGRATRKVREERFTGSGSPCQA
jgi:hypothetical protein